MFIFNIHSDLLLKIRSYKFIFLNALLISFCSCTNENNENNHARNISNDKNKLRQKSNPTTDRGIGPIKNVVLNKIDIKSAERGKIIFESKCISCHRQDNYVGPSLKGITKRRTPEWIMNMILNPEGMAENDPIAREQLQQYRTQMTYQDVSEYEARNILEYFRTEDQKK